MASPIGAQFLPDGFAGPRGLRALAREGSIVELGHYVARRRASSRARRSTPYVGRATGRAAQPVVLVPGFMAGDLSLSLIGRTLRESGHRTYRAQIRANVGCTRTAAEALEQRVEAIAIRRNRKVALVGHSLGGMISRGLAARRPDLVSGIVTMGSPMLAPAAVHRLLLWDLQVLLGLSRLGVGGLMRADCVAGPCAEQSFADSRLPLPEGVAFTAIYSRRDGIVDWKGCIDPQAEAVEVWASHLGMAIDPRVCDVVQDVVSALPAEVPGQAPLLPAYRSAHAG